MKRIDRLLRTERINALAQKLKQGPSVIKLAIAGPQSNVEMDSVNAIKNWVEAKALLAKAKTKERRHAIVRRWIEIAQGPTDLVSIYAEDVDPYLDLRVLWNQRMSEFADSIISKSLFGCLYELRKYARGQLRDRMTIGLHQICRSYGSARQLAVEAGASHMFDSDYGGDYRFEYWLFMEKAAELATREEALQILEEISESRRFDPQQPVCKLLVQKVLEPYL